MNDSISRRAAIEAIIAEGRDVDSRYLESERIIHESDAVEAIAMLPSVQPGIIRCRDCKYCDNYIVEITSYKNMERMEYRCKGFYSSVMPDEYCKQRGETKWIS